MATRRSSRRGAAAAAATQSKPDDNDEPMTTRQQIKIITMQLGEQFDRWNALKEKLEMETHERMAGYLMDM